MSNSDFADSRLLIQMHTPIIPAGKFNCKQEYHELKEKINSLKQKNGKLKERIRDIKIMHEHQYKYDSLEWRNTNQHLQMRLEAKSMEADNWKKEAHEMKQNQMYNQKKINVLQDLVTDLKSQIKSLKYKINSEKENYKLRQKKRKSNTLCNGLNVFDSASVAIPRKRKLSTIDSTNRMNKRLKLANDEWQCVKCSFINVNSNSPSQSCEVCGISKPIPIPIIDHTKIAK